MATEKQIAFINILINQKRNASEPTGFSAASWMDIYNYNKRFWAAVEVNTDGLSNFDASVIIDWLKSGSSTYQHRECVQKFIGENAYAMLVIRDSSTVASIANELIEKLGDRLVEFVATIPVSERPGYKFMDTNELREAVEAFVTVETETMYDVIEQTFGDGTGTEEQITGLVAEYIVDGWEFKPVVSGDEIRMYATRTDKEATGFTRTPSVYANWRKITDDEFYLVIAREVESE